MGKLTTDTDAVLNLLCNVLLVLFSFHKIFVVKWNVVTVWRYPYWMVMMMIAMVVVVVAAAAKNEVITQS